MHTSQAWGWLWDAGPERGLAPLLTLNAALAAWRMLPHWDGGRGPLDSATQMVFDLTSNPFSILPAQGIPIFSIKLA